MRRVALIGSPLRRRHSAVIHNAAFRAAGIEAVYDLIPLQPEGLDGFFAEVRAGEEWLGFQVTAPHKQEAADRCDVVEGAARRIGAVNSVVRVPGGSLTGFNTDAPGFARSVLQDLEFDLDGSLVAVAGAGGASRAVVAAALEAGAARVVVGGRREARVRAVVESFPVDNLVGVGLGPEFDRALGEVGLAVNATTLGMTEPGMAFDPGRLRSGSAVFDLVYVPAVTPLLQAAQAAGLRAVNGAGMLVAQAELAFERWTGITGVGPVMRAALEPLLADAAEA